MTDALEPDTEFAGVQDGFERLWTPHRLAYVTGERPSDDAGDGCPFCAAPAKDDADRAHRAPRRAPATSCMNLFPYNPGHVLVCPYRHVSLYVDLTDEETAEFTALTKQAIAAIDTASGPHGLQHRHEPGRRRRRRGAGPPAPAHRAAVGRRLELPARHRADEGASDAARGRARHDSSQPGRVGQPLQRQEAEQADHQRQEVDLEHDVGLRWKPAQKSSAAYNALPLSHSTIGELNSATSATHCSAWISGGVRRHPRADAVRAAAQRPGEGGAVGPAPAAEPHLGVGRQEVDRHRTDLDHPDRPPRGLRR